MIYQTLLYDKAEREFWWKKCNLDIGIVEERVEHEETDREGRESKSIIIIIIIIIIITTSCTSRD